MKLVNIRLDPGLSEGDIEDSDAPIFAGRTLPGCQSQGVTGGNDGNLPEESDFAQEKGSCRNPSSKKNTCHHLSN